MSGSMCIVNLRCLFLTTWILLSHRIANASLAEIMVKRIQQPIIEYSLETKVVFDFKPKTEIDFYDCLIKDVWCGEQGEGWRL